MVNLHKILSAFIKSDHTFDRYFLHNIIVNITTKFDIILI